MKATVGWTGGMSFEGRTESGHTVPMDAPVSFGGQDQAPRPMEVLLVGAGGCTSFDVVHILKSGHHDVTACRVEIEAERATTDPKVFTRIHFHFVLSGRGLKADRVEHAIRLSAEKYCSASAMLGKTAQITHDFELVD